MFRISLRQLLILVAVIALAIVSLKYASPFWQGFVGLVAMLVLFAAIVAGIFERGPRQAFAIGCSLGMLGYALLIANGKQMPNPSRNIELDCDEGRLPTTLLLRSLHSAIAELKWFDFNTGKVIPDSELGRHPTAPGTMPTAGQQLFPLSSDFTLLGHYWWALLLGYCAGYLARFIYIRRTNEKSANPPTK